MTASRQPDPAGVIGDAIENIFATVDAVRRTALARYAERTSDAGAWTDEDVRALAPAFIDLLRRPGEVAVGLGIILEPGTLASHPLRIEWWEWRAGLDDPAPLEVDLHPQSLNFYDYEAAAWFAVPRRTRQRHVMGPYVDVHGTDRYLLTFTVPLEVDERFLGVAGADVPVTRFESVVLSRLGGSGEAILANDEGRVVLSTSSRWISGCLLPEQQRRPGGAPLPHVPWELVEAPA